MGATSSLLRCRSRQPAAAERGGTINDLFVTALADAAIAYHAERGTEPRSVAMSFVRSTRTGSGAGSNAFVPIKVRAPGAGDSRRALHGAQQRNGTVDASKVSPASASSADSLPSSRRRC